MWLWSEAKVCSPSKGFQNRGRWSWSGRRFWNADCNEGRQIPLSPAATLILPLPCTATLREWHSYITRCTCLGVVSLRSFKHLSTIVGEMKEGREVIVVIQGILVWCQSLPDWHFDFTLIFEWNQQTSLVGFRVTPRYPEWRLWRHGHNSLKCMWFSLEYGV